MDFEKKFRHEEMKLMDNFFLLLQFNYDRSKIDHTHNSVQCFNYFNAYVLQLRHIYVIVYYSLLRFVYIISCVNIFHLLLFF